MTLLALDRNTNFCVLYVHVLLLQQSSNLIISVIVHSHKTTVWVRMKKAGNRDRNVYERLERDRTEVVNCQLMTETRTYNYNVPLERNCQNMATVKGNAVSYHKGRTEDDLHRHLYNHKDKHTSTTRVRNMNRYELVELRYEYLSITSSSIEVRFAEN